MLYSIDASIARTKTGSQVVNAEKGNIEQRQEMSSIYTKTIEDRKRIASFFVSSSQAVSFIESIENLGGVGSDVTISSVSSDNTNTKNPQTLSKISAHVEALGSWQGIMRTLKLSETLPYQASISNVRIDSSGLGSSKDRQWKLSFDIASSMI